MNQTTGRSCRLLFSACLTERGEPSQEGLHYAGLYPISTYYLVDNRSLRYYYFSSLAPGGDDILLVLEIEGRLARGYIICWRHEIIRCARRAPCTGCDD